MRPQLQPSSDHIKLHVRCRFDEHAKLVCICSCGQLQRSQNAILSAPATPVAKLAPPPMQMLKHNESAGTTIERVNRVLEAWVLVTWAAAATQASLGRLQDTLTRWGGHMSTAAAIKALHTYIPKETAPGCRCTSTQRGIQRLAHQGPKCMVATVTCATASHFNDPTDPTHNDCQQVPDRLGTLRAEAYCRLETFVKMLTSMPSSVVSSGGEMNPEQKSQPHNPSAHAAPSLQED